MILLGLYIAARCQGLTLLVEQADGLPWRHIEPLGHRLLPVRGAGQALGVGLVWGLPYRLVYNALIWAVSAGSAWHGGFSMLSVGLGTLPALLARI
jgi:sulfite exporter TauE/SafE